MKYWKIRLLNCTTKEEPNETILLSEFFKMMQLDYPSKIQFRETQVYTKKQFLDSLTDGWSNLIHITAHGESKPVDNRRGKRTEIYIKDEPHTVKSSDIKNLNTKLNVRCVFVSACRNSYKDMADAFCELGAKHYIAPKSDVSWIEAAIFSMMFYKRYIWDVKSFKSAFNYVQEKTKLKKDFPEYWMQ